MTLLENLTPSQRDAVDHREGPLLVLAGPGSGKTRVVTRRIARLVEQGVDDRSILAITFTNKAASEMAARVSELLRGHRVWVGTFHKFCALLLRRCASFVGLQPNFTIYDKTDQLQVIRHVLHELDIDGVHYPPAKIAARISRAKSELHTPETYASAFEQSIGDHTGAIITRVYTAYQKCLLKANAVDFDDLLLHVVMLLSENRELRRDLDNRYRYVLVDEYQDTNLAQYRIVASLTQDHPNLCVTGDPDQSIYGWRGAQIENILRFEAEFPDARVVRLEQNFRSTGLILQAADRLIAHNRHRKAKSLITDNPDGDAVELLKFRDGLHEADFIARQIRASVEAGRAVWSDVAILYRVTALSRQVELALTRHRVPYQVVAGVAFYERAEIKDLLGYLRLVENPVDDAAFRRVVNTPLRGIGKTSVGRLGAWAERTGISLLEAAKRADEVPALSKRAKKSLHAFAGMIGEFSLTQAGSVKTLLETIVERTGYTRAWQSSQSEQELGRLANVHELVTAAAQYDRMADEEPTVGGFLEATSLATNADRLDDSAGMVTLMTLHASKGLEFPVVYIVAVEHGMIPHERSLRSEDWRQLEEERRLLFVGMTRSMRSLHLTETVQREIYGRPLHTIRSEFLTEMKPTAIDCTVMEPTLDSRWQEGPPDANHSATGANGPGVSRRAALTTGAALLNGTSETVDIPQGFAVGMAVRHPRYGLGTIVRVAGMSKRRTVTVEFHEGDRSESFVASKCPLQPVATR